MDAADPVAPGRWWDGALGRVVLNDSPDGYGIRPERNRPPGLVFVPVPDERTAKNRLHPDFRPGDRAAEVARLLALGARPANDGQGEQPWRVLAGPGINEFRVLSSHPA
ncbi:VOC family protein [Streptomyces sp. NPDC085927]|uniref:VOC family protein n=1 Tax=Streptomyces sp. NPDC085927 TaxID=3365738 RepID=UPI0037CE23F7